MLPPASYQLLPSFAGWWEPAPRLGSGCQASGGAESWGMPSLGGQAGIPMELHPSGWFAQEGCSPCEQLAWILAPNPVPNPVPNPLGLTSQGLFSSKEVRPGSWGPPRTKGLPACRWRAHSSRGESCCLREWIWEIQTFPVENPSARADFPQLQERGMPPGSVSDFILLQFVVPAPAAALAGRG